MKKTLCLLLVLVIAFVSIPVFAVYDNSKVYTVIGNDKYYMNGTKLMKDGKMVVNFQDLTYSYGGIEITKEMMKTLLVTDLTHDKWNGHDIIYAVGLVFEPDQDILNDSSKFKDQKIKIGYPYMLVMSYCIGGPTKDIYWYKDNYLMMEAILKYDALWDAAHDVILDESKDPTEDESYDTLYNFAARIVHPRIIMSQHYSHKAYLLVQDTKSDEVNADHIKLFTFNTDRTLKPEYKFTPELFATFWWLNEQGQKYGDYEVRLDRFYLKETQKDHVVIYNFGDEISIALDNDISIHTQPRLAGLYWQYTEQLDLDE
jgi:hypothetical protein